MTIETAATPAIANGRAGFDFRSRVVFCASAAPWDRHDSAERSLAALSALSRDRNDPALNIENADPMEPRDANENADPIERIESTLPIDRIEPVDPIESRERERMRQRYAYQNGRPRKSGSKLIPPCVRMNSGEPAPWADPGIVRAQVECIWFHSLGRPYSATL